MSYSFVQTVKSSDGEKREIRNLLYVKKSSITKNGSVEEKDFCADDQTVVKTGTRVRKPKVTNPRDPHRQQKRQRLNNTPGILAGSSAQPEQIAADHQQDEAEGRAVPQGAFICRGIETPPPAHVHWLIDTFGNKATAAHNHAKIRQEQVDARLLVTNTQHLLSKEE